MESEEFPQTSDMSDTNSSSILSLPPELLTEILSYLSGGEISVASAVCRRFYEGCNEDYVWKIRCRNEFSISDISGWNCSYREIYTKVLYHYGWMVGLWQPDRGCYGGLICVKINNAAGRLEAWSYYPSQPANVKLALRSKLLFTVWICNGETHAQCRTGIGGEVAKQHPIVLTKNANKDLCIKCQSPEKHQTSGDHDLRFWTWLSEEYGFEERNVGVFDQHLYIRKYNTFTEFECEYSCKRILHPRSTPGVVVQPGFFKGDYSAHGVEIIKLGYTDDLKQLELLKITGDPNIPAGCITMKADLLCPMVLTLTQQEELETLSEIDLPDPDPDMQLGQLPSQPFRIPNGCSREGSNLVPESCKWRFSSRGQVAYDNYTRPTFISGHFVVFDEDTLGFLWIDLEAFCLLKRCTETDLACL
ncbi:F-box only protein 31-A-like [Lineus longissimus]|uniref:F-box only protein 31-A-like n=1 Tax=Lineus longissimus TaxID=88925 RepID=UPI002B4DA093